MYFDIINVDIPIMAGYSTSSLAPMALTANSDTLYTSVASEKF